MKKYYKEKVWSMVAAMLAMTILVMMPNVAMALPSFGFDPNCSDRSISDYLAPIFGTLFSSCGGGSGGSGRAFELAIGVLNAGALTFGGILAAYTLVVGTMQTAHDGEMLGKRWSSMWLPIRTVIGVGLVVPISSGYCVAQLLIAFIITQGVGFADSVWSMYLRNYASQRGMAPTNRLPNVTTLAKGVLTSQLCVASFNAVQAKTSGINSEVMSMHGTAVPIPGVFVSSFGLPTSTGHQGNECGSIIYHNNAAGSSAQSMTAASANGLAKVSNDAVSNVNLTPMDTAQIGAVRTMAASLKTTADSIVNFRDSSGGTLDVVGDLNKAIIAYQATMTSTVSGVFSNQDAMTTYITASTTDGWYLAGAWFMKAAQLQDLVNVSVSNVPTTTPPDAVSMGNDKSLALAMAPYFTQLDALGSGYAGAATTAGGAAMGQDLVDVSSSKSGNPLNDALSKFSTAIGGGVFRGLQLNPERSAIMSIKDIGDYTMTASEFAMVSGVTMVAASSGVKALNEGLVGKVAAVVTLNMSRLAGGAAAGAVNVVGYLLIVVGSIFFGLGSMIAVYLPFAPFLLYFGAFVGWLILCGEAIIAAPIWAVMHLTPSGDDIMGGARQGYMLILGLLFRPVLIVLGFIFALTAVNAIVQGFNGVFFPAFKLAMTGSVMGLGTILVMMCIYFGTMVWIFHTVFGLIHVIPDKILRWIGGGGENLGESARGISKAGESGAGTAARHSDAIRQNMMTGIQSGNQISSANRSRAQGLENASSSALMQEKLAVGAAAVADSKASSTGKPEDQLKAVAAHMQAGSAAANTAKADLENKGVNADSEKGGERIAAAQRLAMGQHQEKAEEAAGQMGEKAKSLEANFNDSKSEVSASPEQVQEAATAASNQYKAAASAQEMVGNVNGGNGSLQLMEKSKQVTKDADDYAKTKSATKNNESSPSEKNGESYL